MDILDSSTRVPKNAPSGPTAAAIWRLTGGRASASTWAALLLVVGFALVLAAQVLPWARVVAPTDPDDLSSGTGLFSTSTRVTVSSFETVLALPYTLLWVVVFMLGGMLVFAPASRRRMLFGAAAGALAAQAAVLLPLLHSPAGMIGEVTALEPALHPTMVHTSGSYCVIAAFVVLVAAMIVAVDGNILPGVDPITATPAEPVRPATPAVAVPSAVAVPGAHAVPPAVVPTPAEQTWSSHRVEVIASDPLPETDEAAGMDGSTLPDHDLFRRPAAPESYMKVSDGERAGTLTTRD